MKEYKVTKKIGGSDSPAILGFSPWRTAFQVWLEKTGRQKDETSKETHPWLYWGKVLEPIVADEYAFVTGQEVYEANILAHPEHEWMVGHPDRLIVDKEKILECKIAREVTAKHDWGTEKDAVKIPYIIQVQHYMAIAGADEADIAVLIGNSDFRIYTIPRDETLINLMIDKCGDFYEKYILTDLPPPPKTYQDAAYLWPRDNGKRKDATDAEFLMCQEYKLLRDEKSKLDKEIKKIADKIKIGMQAYSLLQNEGKIIASYKSNSRKSRTLLVK